MLEVDTNQSFHILARCFSLISLFSFLLIQGIQRCIFFPKWLQSNYSNLGSIIILIFLLNSLHSYFIFQSLKVFPFFFVNINFKSICMMKHSEIELQTEEKYLLSDGYILLSTKIPLRRYGRISLQSNYKSLCGTYNMVTDLY